MMIAEQGSRSRLKRNRAALLALRQSATRIHNTHQCSSSDNAAFSHAVYKYAVPALSASIVLPRNNNSSTDWALRGSLPPASDVIPTAPRIACRTLCAVPTLSPRQGSSVLHLESGVDRLKQSKNEHLEPPTNEQPNASAEPLCSLTPHASKRPEGAQRVMCWELAPLASPHALIGNEQAARALERWYCGGHARPAMLMGPCGVGKTALALAFLNARNHAVVRIDSSSTDGADSDGVAIAPLLRSGPRHRALLLDGVESFPRAVARYDLTGARLPIIVTCTNNLPHEEHALLARLRAQCDIIHFRPLSATELVGAAPRLLAGLSHSTRRLAAEFAGEAQGDLRAFVMAARMHTVLFYDVKPDKCELQPATRGRPAVMSPFDAARALITGMARRPADFGSDEVFLFSLLHENYLTAAPQVPARAAGNDLAVTGEDADDLEDPLFAAAAEQRSRLEWSAERAARRARLEGEVALMDELCTWQDALSLGETWMRTPDFAYKPAPAAGALIRCLPPLGSNLHMDIRAPRRGCPRRPSSPHDAASALDDLGARRTFV